MECLQTCSDNRVLKIHVNSNITQPQKTFGFGYTYIGHQDKPLPLTNPGVRLRTSPMGSTLLVCMNGKSIAAAG